MPDKKIKPASLLRGYPKRVSRLLKKLDLAFRSPGKHLKSEQLCSGSPYPELLQLIRLFNSDAVAPEVLYLGDSVLIRISDFDEDKRKLGEMVEANLEGVTRVGCIYYSGYHIRIYYHLLRALATMKQRPRIVILPINMRSFSPQWDLNPLFQYEKEVEILERYIADSARAVESTEELRAHISIFESFDAIPVEYPLSPLTHIGQFHLITRCPPEYTAEQKRFRLQQIFIYHYTHPLVETHSKVMLLDEILKLLTSQGIAVAAYLTPVNHVAGTKYVGEDFLKIYRSNAKIVKSIFASHRDGGRVICQDYSTLLGSNCFFSDDNATEHLNQEGRRILAGRVSQAVVQLNSAANSFALSV